MPNTDAFPTLPAGLVGDDYLDALTLAAREGGRLVPCYRIVAYYARGGQVTYFGTTRDQVRQKIKHLRGDHTVPEQVLVLQCFLPAILIGTTYTYPVGAIGGSEASWAQGW